MIYRVLADGIDILGAEASETLISPTLDTELNSAGDFEFTLPPDHPAYDDVKLMLTLIEIYEDGDLIFIGRPSEITIDWFKQKKVVCEGVLSYMNDTVVRPHDFDGALISDVFRHIITEHNSQVDSSRQFTVGNITITDRYVYTSIDYDNCFTVLKSVCIDTTGGYLFVRKDDNDVLYLDWLAEVPYTNDQVVQFGSNLLDLTQDIRAEDICTVVLPLGAQIDGVNLTIASVNDGSDILEDEDAIAVYGRITRVQSWTDIQDAQSLKEKAQRWLTEEQYDKLSIEVNAAELHYFDGSVGAYKLGQMVDVVSGPHGIDKQYPIIKMSISLDSGTKQVTLGTPPRQELTSLDILTFNASGGSSSGSSGGGGGGSSSGVRDVLVNGSSVVSDHVARVSVPTDAVTEGQMNTAIASAVAPKANTSDVNAALALKANSADVTSALTLKADKSEIIDVEANPSASGTEDLTKIKVGDTVYDIPSGGNSGSAMMSDYYSTDERVVGRWTDGKPLYQKSLVITSNISSNFTVNHGISNIDKIANIFGSIKMSTAGYSEPIIYPGSASNTFVASWANSIQDITSTDIVIFIGTNRLNQGVDSVNITLQYTKTTDAPGTGPTKGNLIYLPSLYSEEEREVGVWTDGKPLYQKTIPITIPNNNSGTVCSVNANVDIMVDLHYHGLNGTDYYNANSSYTTAQLYYHKDDDTIQAANILDWMRSDPGYLTLQYTKTTDQPGSGTWTPDGQLAHHYSTSEKIVGTWVDGSTVYERTQNGGISISANDTWYDTVFTGVNKVISFNCSLLRDGEEIGSTFNNGHIDYVVRNNIIKIKGYNFALGDNFTLDKLTIQYTKTT
jgi:phage minor structural protein